MSPDIAQHPLGAKPPRAEMPGVQFKHAVRLDIYPGSTRMTLTEGRSNKMNIKSYHLLSAHYLKSPVQGALRILSLSMPIVP